MRNDTNDKTTQDNEPLTFIQLGLAAALVVNRMRNAQTLRELQTDEPENGKRDPKHDSDRAKEEQNEIERADLERRMRDILIMENRLRRQTIK
jgi:hypothetical protein